MAQLGPSEIPAGLDTGPGTKRRFEQHERRCERRNWDILDLMGMQYERIEKDSYLRSVLSRFDAWTERRQNGVDTPSQPSINVDPKRPWRP